MEQSLAKYDEVRQLLESRRDKLASICADRIEVTRQIELAVLCCYSQPDLMRCSRASIAASVLEASDLGLSLSRSSGEAYLIPRKDKEKILHCHFQAGYQGLIKLARESGQVNYVHSRVVCRYHDFEWGWNPELEFVHRVDRSGRLGDITHVYCVAKLTSGELVGECMTVEEIQAIRLRSARPNEGPWVTDWEEMAKKTVARRLCKWLPKTPRLIRAIESHDADWELAGVPATSSPFMGEGRVGVASLTLDVSPELETMTTPEPQIAATMPLAASPEPVTKSDRLTAQLAARAAAMKGLHANRGNGVPISQPLATAAPSPSPSPLPLHGGGTGGGRLHRGEGRGEGPPAPRPAAPPAAEVAPTNAQELAELAGRLGTTFFATYGRSRKFPVPMTSWSPAQAKRCWEAYVYERDVVKTLEPAASGR